MHLNDDSVSSNKRLALNLGASFISYLVTFGISFFLSPYIVEKVGVEAYGFVGLANNFVSYAALAAIALNALAGRFITIKIYENDYEGANRYFSSVLISNTAISGVILLVLSVIWMVLEHLINIPPNIFWDVKILFAAVFIECVISTFGSVFSVATFATNKLHLDSLRTIEASVARAVILAVLFFFFSPNVCYLGITALMMTVYCVLYNVHYTRKLLPFIHISAKKFDFGAVKTLLVSGVWNLITRLGQLLSDGLDLLITNILIDEISMGVLSLAKTVPGTITSIVGTLVGIFSPNFTILYAEKKTDELIKAVKQSMKIMGIITNLPVVVLAVCGRDFFALWQPTQNPKVLQILSLLTVGCIVISGGINCIYDVFTVVNKLKLNSIMVVISGFLSSVITLLLINTTDLGIYAVAGVSTSIAIIRNLTFTVPYGAYCLKLKWYTFYPDVLRPFIYAAVSIALGYISVIWISAENWSLLILKSLIVAAVSGVIGFLIVLNNNDRKVIISKLHRRKKNEA